MDHFSGKLHLAVHIRRHPDGSHKRLFLHGIRLQGGEMFFEMGIFSRPDLLRQRIEVVPVCGIRDLLDLRRDAPREQGSQSEDRGDFPDRFHIFSPWLTLPGKYSTQTADFKSETPQSLLPALRFKTARDLKRTCILPCPRYITTDYRFSTSEQKVQV